MPKFRVKIFASLPASAEMDVEAEDEDSAMNYAYQHFDKAHWDGSDIHRPDGSMIDEVVIV
jgi:hypothetical protein